jgi:hypothetical protein
MRQIPRICIDDRLGRQTGEPPESGEAGEKLLEQVINDLLDPGRKSFNSVRLHQKRPRIKLDPKEYAIVRTRVLERDSWRCQECGSMQCLEVHHIKPRSRLGGDVMHNLITLCGGCHGKCHRRCR